jgi:hypothetical protein
VSPSATAPGDAPPDALPGGGGGDRAGFFRRLWRDHEEGVLYAVAVVVYIGLGLWLKTIVLNWVVGPLFPLLVVYLIPTWTRRAWARWAR